MSVLWIVTEAGDFIQLSMATRIYVDGRGRLLAEFYYGDVVVTTDSAKIPGLQSALRTALPGFQDLLSSLFP
jgi:hypothetical protein